MIKSFIHSISIIILLSVISCNSSVNTPSTATHSKIDSITYWIEKVEYNSLSIGENEKILLSAFKLNESVKNDSLKRNNLIDISRVSNGRVNTYLFQQFNNEAHKVSKKAKDSLGIAKTHYYYGYNYYNFLELYDSAYYHLNKAKNYNVALNRTEMVGWCLYEMAYILNDINNFTGSEILLSQSIEKFTQINNDIGLITSNGLLATLYGNLQQYEKSLEYDYKVLKLLEKLKEKNKASSDYVLDLNLVHQSNLGSTYFLMGNYKKAIKHYEDVFTNYRIKDININLYYRLIHNINYTKFKLGDTIHVQKNLYKALKFRDSVNDIAGTIDSKLDIAQFHAYFKDTISAIGYTNEARVLAASIHKNDDYLESLQLLSTFDAKNAKQYLDEYISLNDSLHKEERKIRNKFTRIQFETEEYKHLVEKESHEKILILWFAIAALTIIGLLYYIRIQRSKNNKLLFEKEQRLANEEIYQLILQRQSVMEEGRLKERHRISEELHDGIIGKIFGTRMNLGFLNFTGSSEDKNKYNKLIEELQDVEKEVRIISHELKSEEIELQQNFDSVVDHLLKNQSLIGNFNYSIRTDEVLKWREIPGTIKINIYRILQETIQNCQKHAEATEVVTTFKIEKKKIILNISDNGKGFDANRSKPGIGLTNIKSRVKAMNGSLKIKSKIHGGTQIIVKIPMDSFLTKK